MTPRLSRGRLLPAALALLAAACGDPRHDAAEELLRLKDAMQGHAARYGRLPETLDPARPATPANLPHAAGRGVTLRLAAVAGDGYHATARRGSWLCWQRVRGSEAASPDCVPLSPGASDTASVPASAGALEGLVRPQDAPADSSAPPPGP